ncbi:hypothetical protein [Sphingopyxis sp.]|jgi:hypothetical protein|uniref:hypothetical protein n=1 Tax=Sphingopyxis sp. TaxID=1908224 RepID=UPI002DE94B30|nr:hypothetical protein [Sphingopyxis sp.]
MITARLYCFGYETPAQFENNARHGWDDEDSAAVWIAAASEEAALDWGRSIAEEFVSFLFKCDGKEGYSWAGENFASWIETDPNILAHALEFPAVSVGEMPDFNILSGRA